MCEPCFVAQGADAQAESGGESLYGVLELSIMATEQEIRQQFRRLALRHHPDKACGSSRRFQEIREAFEVLSNPLARSQYDKTLVNQLDIEEYLRRWQELVLTVQGFSLPLHRPSLHRKPKHPQQQQHHHQSQHSQRAWRCQAQPVQAHAPAWGGLLTRA